MMMRMVTEISGEERERRLAFLVLFFFMLRSTFIPGFFPLLPIPVTVLDDDYNTQRKA